MIRLSFLLLLSISFGFSGTAQQEAFKNDPVAADYLAAVSDIYRSQTGLIADLTMTIEMPENDQTIEQSVFAKVKGDKFQIKVGEDVIITNGETLWTYLAEVNEVSIYNYDQNAQLIAPSRLFALYDEDYKYRVKEESETSITIEMSPKDNNLDIFKIDVVIDKESEHIVSSKVYDRSGTRYFFNFEDVDFNQNFNDNLFQFNINDYPDIYVVDTRE